MNSQTSLVARNYRLQQWEVQIQDCQNRPEGMLVEDWCRRNNITKANYYYRLKCVRQAGLDVFLHLLCAVSHILYFTTAMWTLFDNGIAF